MPARQDDHESQQQGPPTSDQIHLQEDDPIEATFLDRSLAFVALVGPACYLISWIQDLLLDLVPKTVSNMSVLAGIIVFLVSVGWLSKRIYRLRMKRGQSHP
ncbi:MAG: hypothetical protein FJ118_02925 [Deltaproteobacteria bacterium]|nr:hypothetical protein [Deltaproteobacteria bacterium]